MHLPFSLLGIDQTKISNLLWRIIDVQFLASGWKLPSTPASSIQRRPAQCPSRSLSHSALLTIRLQWYQKSGIHREPVSAPTCKRKKEGREREKDSNVVQRSLISVHNKRFPFPLGSRCPLVVPSFSVRRIDPRSNEVAVQSDRWSRQTAERKNSLDGRLSDAANRRIEFPREFSNQEIWFPLAVKIPTFPAREWHESFTCALSATSRV